MSVRTCECGAPIVRAPGARGRPPSRCQRCRAPARPRGPRVKRERPKAGVAAALEVELAAMPEHVRVCTEAAAARALADQIDQGLSMTASTRELTRVMGVLRTMAPPRRPAPRAGVDEDEAEVPRGVADLAARAAKRRAAAAG